MPENETNTNATPETDATVTTTTISLKTIAKYGAIALGVVAAAGAVYMYVTRTGDAASVAEGAAEVAAALV